MALGLRNLNLPESFVNSIALENPEAIKTLLETFFNEVMVAERANHLNAERYERSPERRGFANGFKNKTISTRIGPLNLEIPQTRDSSFYPSVIEKGSRSEKALFLAISEMYVQGVSTRKVTKILKELNGLEISSTQVSMISKKMDDELEKFRQREIGAISVLYLDARYEKVRVDGHVRSVAVLLAAGIKPDGHREFLGLSTALSEAEVHWRDFLSSLMARGLHGVQLICSDNHQGLKAARTAVFPSIPWQRCLFHFAQNAQAYVPKVEMRIEVANDIRDIFNCSNKAEAMIKLKAIILKYKTKAKRLSEWLEENAEEAMTFYQFNRQCWKKIKTTNLIERENREIKRRTRVVGIFPNMDSLLRLTTSIIIERHEAWISGNVFMTGSLLEKEEHVEGEM